MTLCLGISAGYAQKIKESEVPAAVKNAYAAKFPDAVGKGDWEKEDGNYEVEMEKRRVSMDNGKTVKEIIEQSVVFSPDGAILQTEVEIKVGELPAAVKEYVNKNFPGKKIKEAAKITEANGTVTYEAEIAKADYIFDADGKFLKKEVENEKDDDDKKKE